MLVAPDEDDGQRAFDSTGSCAERRMEFVSINYTLSIRDQPAWW